MSHEIKENYIVYNTSTDKFLFFKEKDHFSEPFTYGWFNPYDIPIPTDWDWVLVTTETIETLNHDLIEEGIKIIPDLKDRIMDNISPGDIQHSMDEALRIIVDAMKDFRMVGYVDEKPDHLDSHEMSADMYYEFAGSESEDLIMKIL